MMEGKVVALDREKTQRKLRVHVEVDGERLPDNIQLGERVVLVGENGYMAKTTLCERGSQYFLVPSHLRTDGVRHVHAKKVDLTLPDRTIYVFKCEK